MNYNKYLLYLCGFLLVSSSLIHSEESSSVQKIDLIFTTKSKKPINLIVEEKVIVSRVDEETGQTYATTQPIILERKVTNKKSARIRPKTNVITFYAKTDNKTSDEYFIYLPMAEPTTKRAVIEIKARWGFITFTSKDIHVEKNQTFYAF